MKIERVELAGVTVRRFHLLADVTFLDHPAGSGRRNYYEDSELSGLIEDWVGAALEDRDDLPSVSFTDPSRHPAVREIWSWIICANNGHGADTDDLIEILNRHGLPCPEDLGIES